MDSPLPSEDSADSATIVTPALPRVRAPRPAWQEAILMIFTLNFYCCFWLVGRARDIRNAGDQTLSPWLWFFVPIISIAQLFAFPEMFRQFRTLEGEPESKNWQRYSWLWVSVVFILSVASTFYDRLNLPFILVFISCLIIGYLFYLLHKRFNSWKEGLEAIEFHGKESGYHWYEWITLLVFVPLFFGLLYISLEQAFPAAPIKAIEANHQIVSESPKYSLTMSGEGWTQVEIGTHSDGTALAEYSGPLLENYFIIFDHGIAETIESIAQTRFYLIEESVTNPSCTELRQLASDQRSITSLTECSGSQLGVKVKILSALIETEGTIIELLGYANGSAFKFNQITTDMKATALSIQPK